MPIFEGRISRRAFREILFAKIAKNAKICKVLQKFAKSDKMSQAQFWASRTPSLRLDAAKNKKMLIFYFLPHLGANLGSWRPKIEIWLIFVARDKKKTPKTNKNNPRARTAHIMNLSSHQKSLKRGWTIVRKPCRFRLFPDFRGSENRITTKFSTLKKWKIWLPRLEFCQNPKIRQNSGREDDRTPKKGPKSPLKSALVLVKIRGCVPNRAKSDRECRHPKMTIFDPFLPLFASLIYPRPLQKLSQDLAKMPWKRTKNDPKNELFWFLVPLLVIFKKLRHLSPFFDLFAKTPFSGQKGGFSSLFGRKNLPAATKSTTFLKVDFYCAEFAPNLTKSRLKMSQNGSNPPSLMSFHQEKIPKNDLIFGRRNRPFRADSS